MVKALLRAPKRGDVVWLDFDPQSGREQAGRRPAVVLSDAAYNVKSGLALVCPITSRAKGYPFEVPLPAGLPVGGVILGDHIRSLDWQARHAEPFCKLPPAVLDEIVARLLPLLGVED
jgi:mRNA interferase MazF